MDRQKLRALVFEKTGIKVDCDDPIFALVALNEAVLADTVERQVALLNAAAQELALQARGGAHAAGAAPATPLANPPPAGPLFAPRERRLLAGAAAVAAFSALLVLAGQALLAKPQVTPAPVVSALALTPQQSAAIEQGEKLARAVQKLDPKSRALVQAEMQKP